MAVTLEDFRIDIAKVQSFKYLQTKQFDHNSRKRRLIITDSNIPIKYSDERSEYITLSLSINGDNYSNTSCPFEDDGYPYITFTESMLSKVGDVDCEIRIYDHKNGNIITTFTFMMTISKSLLNQDRLVESSEFNILNDLILQALAIGDLLKEYEANKEIIDALIVQINNDISNYQQNYTELSNEARNLISDVSDYLDNARNEELNRIAAENDRVLAEEKRQKDTTDKINDIEQRTNEAISNTESAITDAVTATNDANTATQNANNAAAEALNSASEANMAKDQCLAAIENLHWEIHELDGGAAFTGEEDYQYDYDGGGA